MWKILSGIFAGFCLTMIVVTWMSTPVEAQDPYTGDNTVATKNKYEGRGFLNKKMNREHGVILGKVDIYTRSDRGTGFNFKNVEYFFFVTDSVIAFEYDGRLYMSSEFTLEFRDKISERNIQKSK